MSFVPLQLDLLLDRTELGKPSIRRVHQRPGAPVQMTDVTNTSPGHSVYIGVRVHECMKECKPKMPRKARKPPYRKKNNRAK